jgi:hypothetical protein
MKRKIKFRGKTHAFGWLYGFPIQSDEGQWYIIEDNEICVVEHYDNQHPMGELRQFGYEFATDDDHYSYMEGVRTETVGQFTGLCDVNGTEIYEGDIIHTSDDVNHTVEWDSDHHPYAAGFITRDIEGLIGAYPLNLHWIKLKRPRVIGNIYDNPELLSIAK